MNAKRLILILTLTGLAILPAMAQDDPARKPKPKRPREAVEADPFAADPPRPHRKPAPAEEQAERLAALPKLIQVQVEWIELDHGNLTKLMFLRDPKGDSTELRKEVQALVLNGEAKVVETVIGMCRSGQKATVESVSEFIYPTEYEPASLPEEIEMGKNPPDAAAVSQLLVPATPSAFETRNVGTTLEIEAILGPDGSVIDVRMAPEIVQATGESRWQTVKDSLGNENHVQMPTFYTMRTSTGLTVRDGQYRLAAVQTPNGGDGAAERSRKVMMFLKCDVVTIGEEAIKR